MNSAPSWREHVKVHPAAENFPLLAETAPEELKELARDIAKNGLQQPIVFWTEAQGLERLDPEQVLLLDGRNRLDAIERAFAADLERLAQHIAAALNYTSSQPGSATLLYGDTDPQAYVASANIHRRHLTPEKKREIVTALLKANPGKSDRQIAKEAGSNRDTVGRLRRGLEETGGVSVTDTRTDAAGRQQPASKPPRLPSKEAQIRALREQKPVVVRPPITDGVSTDDVDALQVLLLSLRADPRRIAGMPIEKRISHARTCLAWLNVRLDDLRAP